MREAGLPGKGPQAVIVVRDVDGRLRDLSWAPVAEVEVKPVAADSEDGRVLIRHSATHVLAQVSSSDPDMIGGIIDAVAASPCSRTADACQTLRHNA
jgi:threonyl-tRNA synthetase